MKRFFFIILLIPLLSFQYTIQKFWVCRAFVDVSKTTYSIIKIVQAADIKKADSIFKKYIKSRPDLKKGTIQDPRNPEKYLIEELTINHLIINQKNNKW